MKKIDTLHLYSEAWDGDPSKNRETFIGGSDVGTIMGVNPFKSAYTLWLEKTEQLARENLDSKLSVKLGHKMEQVVAELYEEETRERVTKSNRSYRCKEYPHLIGHIDRRIVGKKKGLEIKTTSSYNKTDYAEGEVPPTHYYQCLFYMMITGMHDWDLVTLRDNRELNINHIAWNEELAEYMLEQVQKFWNCVEKKQWDMEVDSSESTTESISTVYQHVDKEKSTDVVLIGNKQVSYTLQDYFDAKESQKELGKIIDAFENSVKVALGENETGVLEGVTVSWKEYTRKGSIDMKKLEADNPSLDIENYRKPSTTYRKFSLVKPKDWNQKQIEAE